MRGRLTAALAIGALGVASAAGYWAGQNNLSGDGPAIVPEAQAAASEAASGEWSPTKPYPNRDVYYPGTEELNPDEMRVITCGTGMPMPWQCQIAAVPRSLAHVSRAYVSHWPPLSSLLGS